MSNKECEELCRNLSRKELQSLCKKFGLPARKSSAEMAESLISYFQKKDLSFTSSHQSLYGNQGALLPTSMVPTLQLVSPLTLTGNTLTDSVGLRPCTREGGNTGKRNLDFQDSKGCIGLQAYDKEGFDGSTCKFNEAAQFQFFSQSAGCMDNHKEGNVISGSREEKSQQLLCGNINIGTSSKENAFPLNTSSKVPAFEFYATSEEGIKLCVDLSSKPLDWIKKYQNQVYLCENLDNTMGQSLHQELGRIGESNKQMDGSTMNSMYPDQIKGEHVQAKHSSTSVIEENFHMGIGHPDGSNMSVSLPIKRHEEAVDVSGCPQKDQGLISSKPSSDVQKLIILSTESCTKDGDITTIDSGVMNTAVEKTACNFAVNSVSDGSVDLVAQDHQNSKPEDEVCENSILRDSCNLENTSVGLDDLNSKPHDEICENSTPGDHCNPKNTSVVFLGCLKNNSVDMQLSEAGNYSKGASYSPLKNGDVLDLVDGKHNIGTEQEALANSSEIDPCANYLSTCSEEQAWSNNVNQRESSVCSEVDNSSEKTWLKSYNVESSEEFRRKRLHADSEGQNVYSKPDTKVLRIMKYSPLENPPRRSMRLVSK